jgi:hypothetical protein
LFGRIAENSSEGGRRPLPAYRHPSRGCTVTLTVNGAAAVTSCNLGHVIGANPDNGSPPSPSRLSTVSVVTLFGHAAQETVTVSNLLTLPGLGSRYAAVALGLNLPAAIDTTSRSYGAWVTRQGAAGGTCSFGVQLLSPQRSRSFVDTNPAITSRPDWSMLAATAGVACGWFFMNSLITDYDFVQFQFRFYNVLTLMHSPGTIATGASGDGARLDAWLFGTVCLLAVLAALAPALSPRKVAWLGCVAPFALMAFSGLVLYHGFSQDFVDNNGMLGDSGLHLSRFINAAAGKLGAAVSDRIHVGLGGYLSLAASAFLAFKGLRNYQKAPQI